MSKNKSEYLINRHDNQYEVVIGLEVHAQVTSESKLFSTSATKFGAEPNTQVSLVDAAFPGMLPVINEYCVKQAIKTGIGLKAKINKRSVFDRKNYFYADLPQGYQISQYKYPIVGEGSLKITDANGEDKVIGIERIHLEQDAGKSLHDQHPSKSFIDLNRTGVALMEIVSKPDLRSPEEAASYVKKIRTVLRYIETCDGNMEQGSLRADCNVSVRKPNGDLGTRCEIKNLNSIKFISQAIQYEAERQVEILENGGVIDQETRLFDTSTGETRSMRSKEDAHDYRYFPDPDLLPLELSDSQISEIRSDMPELPDQLIERLISEYGITKYDANVIAEEKEYVHYYENSAKNRDGKLVVNWMTSELFGLLKKNNIQFNQNPISPNYLNELVELIENKTISGKIAKDVFEIMFTTSKSPKMIVKEKGLEQVTDDSAIEVFVDQVINENKDKVKEYLSGKDKLFGFFVGQVMKVSQGKANPGLVNKILKSKLK